MEKNREKNGHGDEEGGQAQRDGGEVGLSEWNGMDEEAGKRVGWGKRGL